MKRRKFIKIMAASSAMMAANPFALVSPRPPIIEGGKYRITWVDGHDEPRWMSPQTLNGLNKIHGYHSSELPADYPIPGIKWLTSFDLFCEDDEKKYGIKDDYSDNIPYWYWRDIQLEDKAAFRHFIVGHMESIIEECKWENEAYRENIDKPWPNRSYYMSDDVYHDTMPPWIRHTMIGAGLINDRKLWDWFINHPEVIECYPPGDAKGEGIRRSEHWNWDHLWVDNKMWGPASIKKIG